MSDDQTIDVYQTNAARYAALSISPAQADAIERFCAALPADALILDVGCGPGLHAQALMSHGHRVDAIDATQAFVEAARARGIPARLATFDDIDTTASHDGIYASFSLLHAPRADVPRHVAALARALKPGGQFLLGMKTGSGEARDPLGRHYSYFSPGELSAMLTAQGLTITHKHEGAEAGLSGSIDPYILIHAESPPDA